MKKYLFFATALAALASCTSNDFVGEDTSSTTNQSEQAAIAFGSGVKTVTRADYYGADAASKLNNKFIVGGFKGATGTSTVYNTAGAITTEGVPATGTVFDNYQVNWTANTAGKTQSNTSDWEYVDLDLIAPSTLINNEGVKQSIKYWDYSADQYDFIAYSTGDATVITSGDPTSGQVKVTAIDAANAGKAAGAYALTGDAAGLEKCYIADMVTAYKATMDPAQPKFQDEIQFQFRALASKVRVAIYETIPGYSVKDVKFYKNASTNLNSETSSDKVTAATLFTTGSAAKDNFYTAGTYTVYFPTIGSANISNSDYNKAHVTFIPTTTGKTTMMDFGNLNYKAKEKREKTTGDIWLGRTSATASYAGTADPYYQIALPNEEGTVLELRIDYTLESLDGSGEEIHVYGATAFVPAIYAAWKSNYAYTYIFKISDNTNGWTNTASGASNSVDPAGLYPITFDAVVLETEDRTQSTITTVATPSITTYQKGHDATKDEYIVPAHPNATDKTNDALYAQVMNNGTLVTDLANTNSYFYKLSETAGQTYESEPTGWPTGYYTDAACLIPASGTFSQETPYYKKGPWTEANVMDALNIRTSGDAATVVGRNGITLTPATKDNTVVSVPGADGNWITQFYNNGTLTDIAAGMVAKLSPDAAGTYAYVYDYTSGSPTPDYIYSAVQLATKPDNFTDYYKKTGADTFEKCVDGDFVANKYYYIRYTDLKKTYAVKIIKVVAASGSGS